jgi:hypothetical protein
MMLNVTACQKMEKGVTRKKNNMKKVTELKRL